MGWLDRLFTRLGSKGPNPPSLVGAYYRAWCGRCANVDTPENPELRAAWQEALTGIDRVAFEREMRLLDLFAAVEALNEGPWHGPFASAFVKLIACRMILEQSTDIDSKIQGTLQEIGTLAHLDQRLLEFLAHAQGGSHILALIKKRLQDYRAILAMGWHPASIRLGAYAVEAMTTGYPSSDDFVNDEIWMDKLRKGGRAGNMFLNQVVWIHYVNSRGFFQEICSAIGA